MFTKEQLHVLKDMFPVVVHGPTVPVDNIRYYNGQQSVIEYIEGLVYGEYSREYTNGERVYMHVGEQP